jgi:hypothetical protein
MPTINQTKPRILDWLKETSPYWAAFLVWIAAICAWEAFPKKPIDPEFYETLNAVGKHYFKPEYDIPIYAAATVIAGIAAFFCCMFVVPKKSLELEQQKPTTTLRSALTWVDGVVVCIIIALLWIPDGKTVVEQGLRRDRLFHFDYYYMAPTHAFLSGAQLGTEFYPQYQSGWTLLFASLGSELARDYAFVLSAFSFIGGCIYGVFYILCRKFGASWILAFAVTMIAVYLQIYVQYNAKHWSIPATTILREPFFLALALAFYGYGQRPGLLYGCIAGVIIGLSFLFGTDTGIFSIIAAAFCSLLIMMNSKKLYQYRPVLSLIAMWISAFAVVILGLSIVSRGSIFQAAFWKGYFEVFYLYPSGISSNPIAKTVGWNQKLATFWFCLVFIVYVVTLAKVVARSVKKMPQSQDIAIAFLAVFGLGALVHYVNCSHDHYLYHVTTPVYVLLTIELVRLLQRPIWLLQDNKYASYTRWIGYGCLLLLAIKDRSDAPIRDYPALLLNYAPRSPKPIELREYAEFMKSNESIHGEIAPIVGDASLSVSGEDPTPWLISLKIPPSGRYCPTITFTHQQDRDLLNNLKTEYVLVRKTGFYVHDYLEFLFATRFDLVKETEEYSIYRKRVPNAEAGKD